MNYSELVTQIQGYCEYAEADWVASIPSFVKQAEERIQRRVQLPLYRATTTLTATASTATLSLPSDHIFTYAISVIPTAGGKVPLIQKEQDWIAEAYGDGRTGQPKYYAPYDQTTVFLAPIPDTGYSVELIYNKLITSIVTAGTNWLGDKASNALLFASLVYAAMYMKAEEETITRYEQLFQEAMQSLEGVGNLRSHKDEFRMRDKRPGE